MNIGKIFKKQSVIPWKEIERTRVELENLGWLTQVYDGKSPVYHGTRKGYMSYYLILDSVGLESAANGMKVSAEKLAEAKQWALSQFGHSHMLAEKDVLAKTLEAGGLITITYDAKTSQDSWAITPLGALLLRVFFYSLNKEVGKPPTDWGTEFPKYMLKVFKFMSQISDMMNGMNNSMNGKGNNDPFGQGKMNKVGNFSFGENSNKNIFSFGEEKTKKKKQKKKSKKKPKYKQTNTKKRKEQERNKPKKKQDDFGFNSDQYRFGDKDVKFW